MFRIPGTSADAKSGRGNGSRSNLKVTILGLVALLALGMALLFTGNAVASVAGAFAFILAVIALAVLGVGNVSRIDNTGKQKRGQDGQDIYTLIDRMVDDLDDDEKAYLRRRLEQKEDDLPQRMTNLLDYREEERQAGRR
jgi:hypothetical protein